MANLTKQAGARTTEGKARAFIYYTLSERVLGECLQRALLNTKATKEFFQPKGSILRDTALAPRLLDAAYNLTSVPFALPYDIPELDAAWPNLADTPTPAPMAPSDVGDLLAPGLSPAAAAATATTAAAAPVAQASEDSAAAAADVSMTPIPIAATPEPTRRSTVAPAPGPDPALLQELESLRHQLLAGQQALKEAQGGQSEAAVEATHLRSLLEATEGEKERMVTKLDRVNRQLDESRVAAAAAAESKVSKTKRRTAHPHAANRGRKCSKNGKATVGHLHPAARKLQMTSTH